ncbi:acyltransferase family protein [Pseudobutyrivibrio sp.]|uniref:acyltransferase family protein n=1 Tax=Pseudobutyrivibrio sp. TaxID=2014367 RepID=UPI0025F1606C|nr:acyltransferase [Pseudobutyrivibrio sp.]MBR5648305.1 acyltransferase [Pseudobutyrivibrio sp.]
MSNSDNQRNNFIDLIKFFACIFITNSHCMYLNPLFKLGGGWGNAIFFAVSGFLLGGVTSNIRSWLLRRWNRLLPLTILMTIISLITYGIYQYSAYYHITRFWFVIAILIYYVPFYYVDRCNNGYVIGILLHILFYICIYMMSDKDTFFVELGGLSFFKVYFYFIIMLMGGLVKRTIDKIKYPNPAWCVLTGGFGFIIWFFEYYNIKVLNRYFEWQFLIHFGMTIFGISVLVWALSINEKYSDWTIPKIINLIASSTLEIYLVQITVIPVLNKLKYPLAIIVFWVVALFGGVLLHYLYDKILYKVGKRRK